MPQTRYQRGINIKKRQYRNPIYLAREWQSVLTEGRNISLSDLSRELGFTRARITQIMNLLKLSPEVIEIVSALGDPISIPHITERTLRKLIELPVEEQRSQIKKILEQAKLP